MSSLAKALSDEAGTDALVTCTNQDFNFRNGAARRLKQARAFTHHALPGLAVRFCGLVRLGAELPYGASHRRDRHV